MKKSFFITWTVIWLIIAFQYNSEVSDPFDDKLAQENDFKEIISILDSERINLQSEYNELEEKIWWISFNYKNIDQEKLIEMQKNLWTNEVQWQWVEINISWDVLASHLRDLVNVLREIWNEWIVIWQQRIIYNTPIIDLKTAILVWNTRMKAPITISVIWDWKRIISWISENPILKEFLNKNNSRQIKVEVIPKDILLPKI